MTRKRPKSVASKPMWPWLIAVFSFLIYSNTLSNKFALDDAIVITQNAFVKQGFQGIPSLWKYDSFRGFFQKEGKDQLVVGGRYRPLSLTVFAVEHQLFGMSPGAFHLTQLIWYAALIVVVFYSMKLLLSKAKLPLETRQWICILACFLFAAHPIHTEVVANIKSRDEIMSLLFALLAMISMLSTANNKWKPLLAGLFFFLSLCSKESSLFFVLMIPLAMWWVQGKDWKRAVIQSWPLYLGTILYILLRLSVIPIEFGQSPSMEVMNNPFVEWTGSQYVEVSTSRKLATVFYGLGYYLYLLVWPVDLMHDYFPNSYPIQSWSNPLSIFSLVIYLALIAFSIKLRKRNPILAWCLIFIPASLFLISNLFFPIGTLIGERFAFMASYGFCLILPLIAFTYFRNKKNLLLAAFAMVVLLYSLRAYTRNACLERRLYPFYN